MIKAIVTDIEGTTTRISFVTEALFPYAREHLPTFIRARERDPAVAAELATVRDLMAEPAATLAQIERQLLAWIDSDEKITPLKTLQGMVWMQGYQDGSLKGHIYPDVAPCLRAWRQQGIGLNVYSSGSVAAQKLLFGNSVEGDLTGLFDHFYDTRIGHKREPQSYRQIVTQLELDGDQVLFLSDITAELDAAAKAGMKTMGLDRLCICDGFGAHPFVHHFDQIDLTRL